MPSSNFGVVKTDVDDRDIVHPIARGAEAYYRYATGDSITITLGGERTIRLRELRITARRPQWKLFVGSFWFDQASGQLVRAAYRLAVPIEFWDIASEEIGYDSQRNAAIEAARDSIARERLPRDAYMRDSAARAARPAASDEEPPGWVKAAFRPARGTLDAITIEYGLYGGRFWLPRANSATFNAQIGPLRVPVRHRREVRVRGRERRLHHAAGAGTPSRRGDRSGRFRRRAGLGRRRVGVRVDRRRQPLARGARLRLPRVAVQGRRQHVPAHRIAVQRGASRGLQHALRPRRRCAPAPPCPRSTPRPTTSSISPPATQLLDALGLSLQPAWGPQRPTVRTGLDQIRYNRVEGLSVGVIGQQVLGAGYTARATARLGHADTEFNGELGFERSNGRRTVYANVFRRLRATAPEWGDPLSFGPSLPAILFARDEGFYFRSLGVEIGDRRELRNGAFEWRLYSEQQRTAGDSSVVDTWSLGRSLGLGQFRTNFDASRLSVTGLDVAWSRALVNRTGGLRVVAALRGEGGTGTVTYARASAEGTASRPVGRYALALTGSAGSSIGDLPPQRGWFLGGLRTVRGNAPGSDFGNAYWFLRAEVGTKFGAIRPVGFFDAGWAGSRDAFGQGRHAARCGRRSLLPRRHRAPRRRARSRSRPRVAHRPLLRGAALDGGRLLRPVRVKGGRGSFARRCDPA